MPFHSRRGLGKSDCVMRADNSDANKKFRSKQSSLWPRQQSRSCILTLKPYMLVSAAMIAVIDLKSRTWRVTFSRSKCSKSGESSC